MDLQHESQAQEQQFLQDMADKYGLSGDKKEVFLRKFDKTNKSKNTTDKELAAILWPDELEKSRSQRFTDKLKTICMMFENEGCPIKRQKGGGKYRKGESPPDQAYKWLWETKFPEWKKVHAIDWHDKCKLMLDNPGQRSLTSNYLLGDYEDANFQLDEQTYVPPVVVQRTKPDKRSGESPEAGTLLYEPQYEEKQRFEHSAFLTRILERGEGKTKGKRIALIGKPGAGKTTLLQYIAFWVMGETEPTRQQETKDVAIWISLAALGEQSLEEYLLQTWLKNALRVASVTTAQQFALVKLFNSGRAWLLLDGVDEMRLADPQEAIESQLTGWLASARVVLTCRLNVWQANVSLLANFETYRLLDFDYPQQVHRFIENWFQDSDSAKGEQLKAKLDKVERAQLRDSSQNPLLLALLCWIWQNREGELPQTKAALYQQFVQQFYNWKQRYFPTSTQEQKELNDAFGRLARQNIERGGSRFWMRESYISQVLGNRDDEDSQFHKALKLGWLIDVGIAAESEPQEKAYTFFHPTFEEYFAALAIPSWHFFLNHIPDNPNRPDANYRIFEPQWKEVILLWLGREDVRPQQKEQLIEALVEFDDEKCKHFYHYRAYFLAAAGIAEFRKYSRVDEIVAQLVEWGFGYFDSKKQKWLFIKCIASKARAVLSETERTKASKALVKLIQQDFQEELTRLHAAESLLNIDPGNTIAIKALVDFVQNSKEELTRLHAAESLLNIDPGNSIAIKALVGIFPAESLGEVEKSNFPATEALDKFERDFWDKYVRRLAEKSLEEIEKGNLTGIEALITFFKYDLDKLISLDKFISKEESKKTSEKNGFSKLTTAEALIELIQHQPQNELNLYKAVESLKEILGKAQMARVVTALKDYLSHETYKNYCEQYQLCYQVVWHCAQTLPYPTFYQAWHYPQLTSHPEVLETTGVGFTPISQSLNLAELPTILRARLDKDSDLSKVQLICINGWKFTDSDNPSIKIYNEMQLQGCPQYEDDRLTTIVQLQDYWDRLRRDRPPVYVLVFYANPTVKAEFKFSDSFLKTLSKFDGAICVISDQPNIPLQSFSPNQPNLDVNVVNWIGKSVIEGL